MDKTRDNGEVIKKLFLKRFGDQGYTFRMQGGDPWDEYDCHIVTIIFEISDKTRFWESEGLSEILKPFEGTVYIKLKYIHMDDCGTLDYSEDLQDLDDVPQDTVDSFWEYVKDTISSITFDDIIDYDFGVE